MPLCDQTSCVCERGQDSFLDVNCCHIPQLVNNGPDQQPIFVTPTTVSVGPTTADL